MACSCGCAAFSACPVACSSVSGVCSGAVVVIKPSKKPGLAIAAAQSHLCTKSISNQCYLGAFAHLLLPFICQECQKVAKDFPTINFNSMIVDNTCMQLTGRPDQFDVMV